MYPAAGESSVGLLPEVDMDGLTRLREVVEGIAYVDPVQRGPDSTDAELGDMGPAIAYPLTEQLSSTVSLLLSYVGRGTV